MKIKNFILKPIFIYLVFSICFFGVNAQNLKLQQVWETPAIFETPESVIYNESQDVIYVANINGNTSEKDGNGFISELNPNGKIKTLKWIENLNAPKGLAIFEEKLYVADIDQLVEIDIKKGEILNKYDAPGAVFLNDVTSCLNGMVFVSDSRAAKIYVFHQGEIKVWMEGDPLKSPNGLLAENGKLFVGDSNIYEVDILTQEVITIIENTSGIDGLEKNKDGEFLISYWKGQIFINKNGENIKLHDSVKQEIYTADIDFALKYNLILVPTFSDNRVIAYRITE